MKQISKSNSSKWPWWKPQGKAERKPARRPADSKWPWWTPQTGEAT